LTENKHLKKSGNSRTINTGEKSGEIDPGDYFLNLFKFTEAKKERFGQT